MIVHQVKIIFSTRKKGKVDTYSTTAGIVPANGFTYIVLYETKRDLKRKQHHIEDVVRIETEGYAFECTSLTYVGMVCKYPVLSCQPVG